MKAVAFLSILLFTHISIASLNWDSISSVLQKKIDTLHNGDGDGAKEFLNEELNSYLQELAQLDGFFSADFSGLKYMLIKNSPDNAFKLVSYNYETSQGKLDYQGMIVLNEKKKGKYIVHVLEANPYLYRPRYPDNHTPAEWYGALYYDIVMCEGNLDKYYVLLAYDGNGVCSTTKFLESMQIKKGKVSFGHRIFQVIDEKTGKRQTSKRVFLEYKKEAYASLKYHSDNNRIVLDHVQPENASMIGIYCYYSPTFSLDAYTWCSDKDLWVLHEDVVQTSDEGEGVEHSPFDTGNPNGPSPFATASTSKLDDCVPLGTQVTSTQTPSNVKRKKKKKKKKNPEYLDRGNESSIMSQGKK